MGDAGLGREGEGIGPGKGRSIAPENGKSRLLAAVSKGGGASHDVFC